MNKLEYLELTEEGNWEPIQRPDIFVAVIYKDSMCVEPELIEVVKKFVFDGSQLTDVYSIESFRDFLENEGGEQLCGDNAEFFTYLTKEAYDNGKFYEWIEGWSGNDPLDFVDDGD